MIFTFSKGEYFKHVIGNYLFWAVLATVAVCGLLVAVGTFKPVCIPVIGGFAILVCAIVFVGRIAGLSAACVEIKDSQVTYSLFAAGFEDIEFNARGLSYVAETVNSVEQTKKGLKISGNIHVYGVHQQGSTAKHNEHRADSFVIPYFFEKQVQMLNEINKICGR